MADERPLIKPEEYVLEDADGISHTYVLSNFDAIAGRHIISQYPMTGLPKVGDYPENEKLMFKLMSYVAVVTNSNQILRLSTPELILNHVPDFEMLAKIEIKMMAKNCSFFRNGQSLSFCDNIAQIFTKKILEMLTLSSEQSSQPEKQPTTNSEPSTT